MRTSLPKGRRAATMAHLNPGNRRPKTQFASPEPIKPLPRRNQTC